MEPRTDEDCQGLRKQALLLIEGANLLMLEDGSDFAAATSMSDLSDDFEQHLQRRKSKEAAARARPT